MNLETDTCLECAYRQRIIETTEDDVKVLVHRCDLTGDNIYFPDRHSCGAFIERENVSPLSLREQIARNGGRD